MSKRPDTWMPFYIGDYLRDTSRLTTEGHGAYMLLIFDYWVSGQPLPDDDQQLAAVTRLTVSKWKALRPTIARFFQIGDGVWHHKRIDKELGEATKRIDKRSAAGSEGARARWGLRTDKGNGNRIANASEPQCDGIADANAPSQYTVTERKGDTPLCPPLPNDGASDGSNGSGRKRDTGHRLPADWQPNADDWQFAQGLGLDPEWAADEFRDYWLPLPDGPRSRKKDWSATFRNRCRELASRNRGNGASRPRGYRLGSSGIAAALNQVRLAGEDYDPH